MHANKYRLLYTPSLISHLDTRTSIKWWRSPSMACSQWKTIKQHSSNIQEQRSIVIFRPHIRLNIWNIYIFSVRIIVLPNCSTAMPIKSSTPYTNAWFSTISLKIRKNEKYFCTLFGRSTKSWWIINRLQIHQIYQFSLEDVNSVSTEDPDDLLEVAESPEGEDSDSNMFSFNSELLILRWSSLDLKSAESSGSVNFTMRPDPVMNGCFNASSAVARAFTSIHNNLSRKSLHSLFKLQLSGNRSPSLSRQWMFRKTSFIVLPLKGIYPVTRT